MTTSTEGAAGVPAPDDLPIDLDAPTEHQVAGGGRRAVSLALVIGGAVGLIASFALMLERIALLRDPDHVPSCNFREPADQLRVGDGDTAAFAPEPLLGIASSAALVAIGVALPRQARGCGAGSGSGCRPGRCSAPASQAGHIPASRGVRTAMVRNRAIIVLVWYAAVVAFGLTKFWADFFG